MGVKIKFFCGYCGTTWVDYVYGSVVDMPNCHKCGVNHQVEGVALKSSDGDVFGYNKGQEGS